MGERLSKPIREKEKIDGSTTDLEFGICTMQGYRITMEDAFFYSTNLIPDTKMSIFGILYCLFFSHSSISIRTIY